MGFFDDFELLDPVNGIPSMSITKHGVSFNKSALEKLGCPENVKALLDKKGKRFAIISCEKEDRGARKFCKKGRDISNGVRWNNYDLKITLETLMGWNLAEQSWKSIGSYSEDERALIFDLLAVEDISRQ